MKKTGEAEPTETRRKVGVVRIDIQPNALVAISHQDGFGIVKDLGNLVAAMHFSASVLYGSV